MSDTNLTSVASLLKQVYDDYVETQQNLKSDTIDHFSKSSTKYSPGGQGYYGAISDYGNETVGAINEEESFRTIDAEHYQQWKVIPKVLVAPIQFSGLVSKAAEGGEESFAKAVVDALDKARVRLKKDKNRQFFGSGTGTLGAPNAAIASNLTSFTVASAQYFRANQVVDIFTSTGGVSVQTAVRISDVDKVNGIIYLSASIGVSLATTNVIVKQNILNSAPADGKEIMGLAGMCDDSTLLQTFQNLDATAVRIWRGRAIAAGTVNLTSDLLQRLIDDVQVLGGDEVDTLIMHEKQRRKYLDIVVPQKRYESQDMDAGHGKLSFNGIELMLDSDCQDDSVYAIKKDMIRMFELGPMAMASEQGSDVFLRIANADQFQAYWRHYCNAGTSKRNALGKITGLTKPTGVA